MAISHARSGESINVQPFGPRLSQERTAALFKSEELEVIRLVLPAGKSMPPHRVAGALTLQCLEGQLSVTTEGASQLLDAGHMLFLPGHALHGVTAVRDASALLTIVLHGKPPTPA